MRQSATCRLPSESRKLNETCNLGLLLASLSHVSSSCNSMYVQWVAHCKAPSCTPKMWVLCTGVPCCGCTHFKAQRAFLYPSSGTLVPQHGANTVCDVKKVDKQPEYKTPRTRYVASPCLFLSKVRKPPERSLSYVLWYSGMVDTVLGSDLPCRSEVRSAPTPYIVLPSADQAELTAHYCTNYCVSSHSD